jgi:hypothetical protein
MVVVVPYIVVLTESGVGVQRKNVWSKSPGSFKPVPVRSALLLCSEGYQV